MDSSNPQRLIRAIEICTLSGKTHAQLQTTTSKSRNYTPVMTALDIPRDALYERINVRVDRMMDDGLLDEVKSLADYRHLNSLKTVGYSELFEYLDGNCTLEHAVDKIKQHSRNYAKRQITWFKKMNMKWFSPEDFDGILEYFRRRTD